MLALFSIYFPRQEERRNRSLPDVSAIAMHERSATYGVILSHLCTNANGNLHLFQVYLKVEGLCFSLAACGSKRKTGKRGFCGDTPRPGQGLPPLTTLLFPTFKRPCHLFNVILLKIPYVPARCTTPNCIIYSLFRRCIFMRRATRQRSWQEGYNTICNCSTRWNVDTFERLLKWTAQKNC